jgi:hypothetical protein
MRVDTATEILQTASELPYWAYREKECVLNVAK